MYCIYGIKRSRLFSRDILERKDRKKQAGGDVEMTDVSVMALYFIY